MVRGEAPAENAFLVRYRPKRAFLSVKFSKFSVNEDVKARKQPVLFVFRTRTSIVSTRLVGHKETVFKALIDRYKLRRERQLDRERSLDPIALVEEQSGPSYVLWPACFCWQ